MNDIPDDARIQSYTYVADSKPFTMPSYPERHVFRVCVNGEEQYYQQYDNTVDVICVPGDVVEIYVWYRGDAPWSLPDIGYKAMEHERK